MVEWGCSQKGGPDNENYQFNLEIDDDFVIAEFTLWWCKPGEGPEPIEKHEGTAKGIEMAPLAVARALLAWQPTIL